MNKPLLFVLVGAVAALIALALTFLPEPDPDPAMPPSPPPVAGPSVGTQVRPAEEAVEPNTVVPPGFDVVRISPAGDAVIAGRATPNAEVTILDGDKEIGRLTADERGEWVFVPTEPLSAGNRELSLRATNPNGKEMTSEDVVVLSVPERTAPDSRTLAVQVPRDGGASTVLQGTGAGSVTIDAVDYDDTGKVALSGRAEPNRKVHVYADNTFLGRAIADENGRWKLLPDRKMDQGSHTLRADALDENNKVTARMEAEFVPGEPLKVAADTIVVVRGGTSLWRLARRLYGSGFAYTAIYQANKDTIRDPDLIYPGQVFTLPRRD